MEDNSQEFKEWAPDAATRDHHKPDFHLAPPFGWMNDPNGLVFFDGYYHAFYQYHPHSAQWGPMHWGHARSQDMLTWEHLPIALYPDMPYDAGGCFSGTAFPDGDSLVLAYTGNLESGQNQNIAISQDGINFAKHHANPVIPCHPQQGSKDFRDPKIWRQDGVWYLMMGTCSDGQGKVALYSSPDLEHWEYLGMPAESAEKLGNMWECPDLFRLQGRDVLIFSPMGMEGHKNIYLLGNMNLDSHKYTWESFDELDWGVDFYAAQTFLTPDGRRILMAWMDMWGKPMPTQARGWAGALTLPRELSIGEDGHLRQVPVRELLAYRHMLDTNNSACDGWIVVPGSEGTGCLDMELTLVQGSPGCERMGLDVCCSEDGSEGTTILWDIVTNHLHISRENSGEGCLESCSAPLPPVADNGLELRIVIDHSSIEVFALGGNVAMTCRVYPKPGSTGVRSSTTGTIHGMKVWTLGLE